ncbi:uncharacterized protein B0I36DRAFT_299991 [Microdochium trichocladiopsis]|uniref:Fungal-type protein kinase domain-containing protein n=1 Tax=Microdochium trichocladiopsis TaxID=1682393 RepID=A0A9P8XQF6_9PEZI|nr:uncharacterized protein B0I36DRAFT_299991 [Microdochium trichocladiopsis]KAH7012084.1 hypothetical protein B0I36DRAFT_299991 [Microdochium trichocladiopsis]
MVHDQRAIIKNNPLRDSLTDFSASLRSACVKYQLAAPPALDALPPNGRLACLLLFPHEADKCAERRNLTAVLLSSLSRSTASKLLPTSSGSRTIDYELKSLLENTHPNNFELSRTDPILAIALVEPIDESQLWDLVYKLIPEATPPPRSTAPSHQQTPWVYSTSSLVNSSELRRDVDDVLKSELGPLYVDIPQFFETFFESIPGLAAASKAVFEKCKDETEGLFSTDWTGWPEAADQDGVLSWFVNVTKKLASFSPAALLPSRKLLASPNTAIQGSTGERKLDLGFVDSVSEDARHSWIHIMIPGELKSNPKADASSKTWHDLARYVREVLSAQYTRRFVLGFTMCGSLMRVWHFDRLGGIASESFDIHEDGERFVLIVLGFLCMNEEQIGLDPTFTTVDGQQVLEIHRNGALERFIIDEPIVRARCIVGRATTCWRAHKEGEEDRSYVIKDSWQPSKRSEEGELLRHATESGVINVPCYYHHYTVQVGHEADDVLNNVRRGLDITRAKICPPARAGGASMSGSARTGRRSGASGSKRTSSQAGALLPPNKRSCSRSPTNPGSTELANREHRRVITYGYGIPIYEARSRSAFLGAMVDCIQAHESMLVKAEQLHRDISLNNLLIRKDNADVLHGGLLIDLDLTIKKQREGPSGAEGMTGTRAFMAIGALLKEQHTFLHDLESFFWVLFWICIHYNQNGEPRITDRFERWNYIDPKDLADLKKGVVSDQRDFLETVGEVFNEHYRVLIRYVDDLREVVFPDGRRRKFREELPEEHLELYSLMTNILRKAQEDTAIKD